MRTKWCDNGRERIGETAGRTTRTLTSRWSPILRARGRKPHGIRASRGAGGHRRNGRCAAGPRRRIDQPGPLGTEDPVEATIEDHGHLRRRRGAGGDGNPGDHRAPPIGAVGHRAQFGTGPVAAHQVLAAQRPGTAHHGPTPVRLGDALVGIRDRPNWRRTRPNWPVHRPRSSPRV